MSNFRGVVKHLAHACGYYLGKLPVDTLGEHLKKLLALLKINVVLDVGAHVGEYGRFLRGIGYGGQIISFEPVPENFRLLQRNVAHSPRWRAVELALGAQEGMLPMNIARETVFSSFLQPNAYSQEAFADSSQVTRTEQVPVMPLARVLDSLLNGVEQPRILLKLDTQGFDLEVLKGAEPCLDRILAIQTEVSVKPIYEGMPNYLESIRALNQLGFELSGLFSVSRDRALRAIEFDCVMRRAETQPAQPGPGG